MWAISRASIQLRGKGLLSSYSKSSGLQREVHGYSSQQTGAKINGEALKKEFSRRVDVQDKEMMLKIMKERVYNAEKLYRLMKDKVYAPRLRAGSFNRKITMKRVELPTHYAEYIATNDTHRAVMNPMIGKIGGNDNGKGGGMLLRMRSPFRSRDAFENALARYNLAQLFMCIAAYLSCARIEVLTSFNSS